MASRRPLDYPVFQAFDANGNPLSSGTVEFFDAGTTDQRNTYSDPELTTANPNPVTLNSRGEPQSGGGSAISIYLDDEPYKIVLKDSDGATVRTIDDYLAPPSTQLNQPETLSDLQDLNTSTFTSGDTVYLRGRSSAGDGGEGHFRWDSSDLSTEVSNDEVTSSQGDGGIYIAPASDKTGASGAWVRQDIAKGLTNEHYGLSPGDYEGNNSKIKTFMEACINNNVACIFQDGTWTWDGTMTVDIPDGHVFILRGQGPDRTIFERSARNLDSGDARLISCDAVGSKAIVDIADIQIDGNADENPLLLQVDDETGFQVGETITGGTSGTTATVLVVESGQLGVDFDIGTFQNGETVTGGTSAASTTTTASLSFGAREQSDSLGIIGDYEKVRLDRVIFTDPAGDGWNMRGGDKQIIEVTSVSERNRTRFRNMVTLNGALHHISLDQCYGGRLSFESASEKDTALIGSVSNSELDINLAYDASASAGGDSVLNVTSSKILSLAGGGDGMTIFDDCLINAAGWRPTGDGILKFNFSEFYAEDDDSTHDVADTGATYLHPETACPDQMHFYECVFRPLPSAYVSNNSPDAVLGFRLEGDEWSHYSVIRCKFLDEDVPAVSMAFFPSAGILEISENEYHYDPDGGDSQNIRHAREFFPQTTDERNTYIIHNNKIMNDDATLIRFVSFHSNFNSIPIIYSFKGNHHVSVNANDGPMYVIPDTTEIVSPHGTGDEIVLQSVDQLEGDSAPASGDFVQGQKVYERVPSAGGKEGWVCTASGSPGTWKEFGTVAS